jgi:hypothetical protein
VKRALLGVDYFRHDGQIQDVAGNVFGTSKSAFMLGAAPVAVFATTDAIFAPLAERQNVRAREAGLTRWRPRSPRRTRADEDGSHPRGAAM